MNRRKFFILLSITSVYFFAFFQRVAVPGTIFNELQSAFEVSAAAIAALGAIYLYIYGGMQIFAGILADTLGASGTLIMGGGLLAAGSVFFPLSESVPHLYAFRAMVGMGSSLIYISMLKHINVNFRDKDFPFVLSAGIVLGYTGGLVATYPFERAAASLGWQNALLWAGIICVLAVIVMWRILGKNPAPGNGDYSGVMIKKILKNRNMLPVLFSGSLNFAVYFLIQATIGKKMLEDFAGLTSSAAAGFTFWMMFTTMASVLLHGFIGRRTPRRRPFAIAASCISASATLIILFNLSYGGDRALLFAAYLMSAYSAGNILNATLAKELNPPEAAGTAVGFYNGAIYTAVAIISNAAGIIMDRYLETAVIAPEAIIYPAEAYRSIFLLCLALNAVSLTSAMRIREPSAGKPFLSDGSLAIPR